MTDRWLLLLRLLILADAIGSALAAYALWQFRRNGHSELITRLALLLASWAFFWLMSFCALAFGFEVQPRHTTGYILCYWTGRTVLSFSLWKVILFLLKRH